MSLQTKLDYQYKYLFLGDTNVGKTSLLIRYTESIFDPESLPTLGVDVRYKYVTLENKRIRLDIWDTAGQERFKMITKNYLNGANGIIFVYDITSKDTFDKLKLWIKEAESNVSPDTEMIIVGNKIDLDEKRVIQLDLANNLGKKHNIEVIEASAKTGKGVNEIFSFLTENLFKKKNIGLIIPGEDEVSMRRGSYILKPENVKTKNNEKHDIKGCNC